MTDIDLTAAKDEAARRWPSKNIRDPLPADWLNEGMASGFVLGTQWALAQVERVKPTREDVARALSVADVHHPDFCDCGDFDAAQWCDGLEQQIDAVLALLPGRTEAEVRAEALQEAAEEIIAQHDREVAAKALRDAAGSPIPRWALATGTRAWLRDRADQIEEGSNDK